MLIILNYAALCCIMRIMGVDLKSLYPVLALWLAFPYIYNMWNVNYRCDLLDDNKHYTSFDSCL